MDEEDLKKAVRVIITIALSITLAFVAIYSIIVAGWEVDAYVNKISPPPPKCIDQCDGYTYKVTPDAGK